MSEEISYNVSNYLYGWQTEKAKEMRKRAMSRWAKRRRTKAVICPVTGEETDHHSGLSRRAWNLIERGVKAEEHDAQIAGETEVYHAHGSWLSSFAFRPPEQQRKGESSFIHVSYLNLIRALTGDEGGRVYSQVKGAEENRLELLNPFKGSEYECVRLTPQQAEAVRLFGLALEQLLKKTAEENFKAGSALLVKLATGDITIDEVNAAHDRREKVST
jgi:hypothetical protein